MSNITTVEADPGGLADPMSGEHGHGGVHGSD